MASIEKHIPLLASKSRFKLFLLDAQHCRAGGLTAHATESERIGSYPFVLKRSTYPVSFARNWLVTPRT